MAGDMGIGSTISLCALYSGWQNRSGGEDVDFVDEAKRDHLLARKTKTLGKKIRKMFPHVFLEIGQRLDRDFCGVEGWPTLYRTIKDFPGAQFGLGYGGNGITFATIASAIIPDLISGNHNSDSRLFRFDRKSG